MAGAVDDGVLLDFEGGDAATLEGVRATREIAATGSASGKWAGQIATPHVVATNIPHDWSAYDTLSLRLHSAVANGARIMLVVGSDNPATEGPDYYCAEIKVDWTGWRHLEYAFRDLKAVRCPVGWAKIDSFGLHASGWGNVPDADTVLHIDDVRLVHYGARVINGSFDTGADGEGVPNGWKFSPKGDGKTGWTTLEDGGRTGKCVKIVDKNPKRGFGVVQYVPVEPGRKYTLTAWKKGDRIVYYLNFYDARGKKIGREHTTATGTRGNGEWKKFGFSRSAPEGAKSVRVWIYSTSSNQGTFYIDDVHLEESE